MAKNSITVLFSQERIDFLLIRGAPSMGLLSVKGLNSGTVSCTLGRTKEELNQNRYFIASQ